MDKKDHWENIYSEKSHREVSWYQAEPTLSLKLIQHCQLEKSQAIIDVGGGASALVDKLLDQAYNKLAVLDISSSALKQAKQRLGTEADTIEWFTQDITAFIAPHPFSLWHDRAVFHFLTEVADRQKYITALKAALPSGGYLILAAFTIGGPTQCSGLNIVQYDMTKICHALGDEFEFIEEDSEIHLTPSSAEQLFSYFRFVRK